MIDRKTFFDETIRNDLKTYDNVRKITTCQRYDYAFGCLLDCPYFKAIAIDLNKQQALNAKPKAIQQTNFT